jgi:hypothetical protein
LLVVVFKYHPYSLRFVVEIENSLLAIVVLYRSSAVYLKQDYIYILVRNSVANNLIQADPSWRSNQSGICELSQGLDWIGLDLKNYGSAPLDRDLIRTKSEPARIVCNTG